MSLTFNEAKEFRFWNLLAMLVSGQNPDGTALGDHNQLVAEASAAFANSAAAGTPVDVDVGLPAKLHKEARYLVAVHNPGGVAITIRLQNRETLNGAARFPQAMQFGVPAGGEVMQIVEGWLLGETPSRMRVTNDGAVALDGAFTAAIRVRKV